MAAAVILSILKILGIFIVIILSALIVALLLALLSPIKFGLKIDTAEKIEADFFISCFLGLIWIKGGYFGEDIFYDYGYPLKNFSFKKFKRVKKRRDADIKDSKAEPAKKHERAEDFKEEFAERKSNGGNFENCGGDAFEGNTFEEKESLGSDESIINKISRVWELFSQIQSKKNIADCLFYNIKYLFFKIKFKTECFDVLFGFEDPSLTGRVLGILYALGIPFITGTDIRTDFNKSTFEAKINLKGKIRLIFIIIPIIRVISNKDTVKAFKRILSKEG